MYWEITAIILVGVLFFLFLYETKDAHFTTIEIGNESLNAEVADTFFKKAKGLMFRDKIGTDAMLFVNSFPQKSGIWMKGMRFPIDIIWVNDGEVVDIHQNAKPCGKLECTIYSPGKSAKYVIETPANWTKENQINVGTKVKIENYD